MKPRSRSSLLLAYYGDDFTGSTDVLESLSCAGVKTVLFLEPPGPRQLARFPGLRAFGIAGGSRAMSPREMESALPPAFRALKTSGARFIHYKTCSTFDSSPVVGSVGKAIQLGRRVFRGGITPLVVGVPILGRYVVFGNLFARSGLDTEPSRLDRHPTMRHHPVTPMDEADLRIHLARQTSQPVELIDVLKIRKAAAAGDLPRLLDKFSARKSPPIVLFDTLDEADLPIIGRLISGQAPVSGQIFCVGSSGVEYALVAHWRESGVLSGKRMNDAERPQHSRAATRGQIVTVSGSCSPVTDRQIRFAIKAGFIDISCDSAMLADANSCAIAVEAAMTRAAHALDNGRNVIFHTARGAADARRAGFQRSAAHSGGKSKAERLARAGANLGAGLAQILDLSLARTGARRAVVCGGDTATHIARALGIEALEFTARFAPGAPLCRVHAPRAAVHGRDVIFKGGQVGRDTFFADLANGGAA